ncbi:MAG: hypothetical protein IJB70_04730 [Clostridia bacterium]|nr:hypothetical protein [Clostridia bacterium]
MTPINIAQKREVFWDNFLLDEEKTTAFHRSFNLTEKEVCTVLNQGKELESVSWLQVLKLPDGGYRMYYCPWSQWDKEIVIRLAVLESSDGLSWTRPSLNLFPHPELKENNIVIDHLIDNAYVFYDTNPNCPEDEKFKAVCSDKAVSKDTGYDSCLICYTSQDGLNFKKGWVLSETGTFDTLNTVHFRDGKYYAYIRDYHGFVPGKRESTGIRDIRVMTSEDFHTWTIPEELEYDDGLDYPMYTNNIHPYERAPQIRIGFPVRYYDRGEWTPNTAQFGSAPIKEDVMKMEARYGIAVTDCVFIHSRDVNGKKWSRSGEAFMTPGYETDENWMYGDCYLASNMIDSGKETYYMYCDKSCRTRGKGKEIIRYEIRKDGFACIMAGGEEKVAVTKPIVFEGKELHLNFETSAFGHIFVDVLDENGDEIPGKTSFEIYGNTIDRKVFLKDETDFSALSGKTVRLRFRMKDAKLYSIKFED